MYRSSKVVVEGIVNAAYNKRIRDAYVRMTNHQVSKGVAGQAALTINEGATQAPFDRDQYKVCMDLMWRPHFSDSTPPSAPRQQLLLVCRWIGPMVG